LRRSTLSQGFESDYTEDEVQQSNHLRSEFSEQTRERMRRIQYMEVRYPEAQYNATVDSAVRARGGDCRFDRTAAEAICVFPADPESDGLARNPTSSECAADLSPTAHAAVSRGAYVDSRSLLNRVQDNGEEALSGAVRAAGAATVAKLAIPFLIKAAGATALIPVGGWVASAGLLAVAGGAAVLGGVWSFRSAERQDARAVDRLLAQPGVTEEIENYAVCLWFAALDVTRESLPAWRWRQGAELYSDGGISSASFLGFFASLAFTTASTFWGWLIDLLRQGTSLDVLSGRAGQVNEFFLMVTEGLRDSGLPLLALIFTLLASVGLLLRGRGAGAFRTFFLAAVPLAVLLGLANVTKVQYLTSEEYPWADSMSIPVNVDFATGVPRGSPGWLGIRGAALTQTISQNLLSGFGTVSIGANTLDAVLGDDNTACSAYVRTLYEQVDGTSLNRVLFGRGNDRTMAYAGSSDVVAMLWQAGFLNPWIVAQYGSLDEGRHLYCFDMERRAQVPPAEQQALLRNAFRSGDGTPGVEFQLEAFSPFGDELDRQARLFAWAACAPDVSGRMNPNPEWQKIAGPAVSRDTCEGWFLRGDTTLLEGLKFRNMADLNAAAQGAAGAGSAGAAYEAVVAYWGERGSQRFSQSILAAVVSGIYLYSVGGIAVGSILAQYGLFILLSLLPATLVLVAFPGPDGKRNQGGMRLLKLTGAMFFAKLMLDLVLTTLMQLITLLTGLSGTVNLSSGVSAALVPLAALLVLRKILQTAGMGNIMTLTGATALTANVAAASTRDAALAGAVSKSFGNEGGELRRAARFARSINPARMYNRYIQQSYYRGNRRMQAMKRRKDKFDSRTAPKVLRTRSRRELNRAMQVAADQSGQLADGTAASVGELEAPIGDDLDYEVSHRQGAHRRAISQTVANETAQRALESPGMSAAQLEDFAKEREKELTAAADELDESLMEKMTQRSSLADEVRELQAEIDRSPPSAANQNRLEGLKEQLGAVEEEIGKVLEAFAAGLAEALKGSLAEFSASFGSSESEYREKYGRRLRKGPELSPNMPPPLN
jgi:hypothetical protein